MAAARGSCPLCARRSGKGGQEEGRGHGAGGVACAEVKSPRPI